MGSWSPATPTGAGGERGWLWFSFSPSLTHFPGTQPHTECLSCSSCPFALSRKQGSFHWGCYKMSDHFLRLCLLFPQQESWGTTSSHSTVRNVHTCNTLNAGRRLSVLPETCWECAAPKGTKCLPQAEASLGSAIHRELIFPTINELDTNALIFKATNASVV